MPRIGLRTIKTATAVMITMFIYLLLYIISPENAQEWYSPFFAGIAAAYSMQRENAKSFFQARVRALGSIFGGLFGMAIILLYESTIMDLIILNWGYVYHLAALYTITSIFLIILIHFLVLFKKHDLIFVAILTYLSIIVSTRNNLPVIVFGIERISSTIIGVMVALLVNNIHLYRHKNNDILFVSGLDKCLLNSEQKLTPYASYTLTSLIEDGLDFTISTTKTPASLTKILYSIPLNQDLMIMNGAVTYNLKNDKYLNIIPISKLAQNGIDQYFSKINRNIFTFTIFDQSLSIYRMKFANEAEEKFYLDRKNEYFVNHVRGKLTETEDAVYYILIDRKETVESYVKDLQSFSFSDDISFNIYPYPFFDNYYFLKINNSHTSKKLALEHFLTKHNKRYVVSFGSMPFDIDLMNASDFSITLECATNEVKEIADLVLPSNSPDDMVREIKKIYHAKDPILYLNNKKQRLPK